jgi:WD40 repeat protein
MMAEEPQVYAVERDAVGRVRLTRREFVAAGATVAAVTVAGCSGDEVRRRLGEGSAEPAQAEASGECRTILAHQSAVNALAYSPDGSRLASGGAFTQDVKVWEMPDGTWLVSLAGQRAGVTALAQAPDGSWVASADEDGVVKGWSVADGAEIASREDHGGAVHCLAVAPDGSWLASAGADARIVLLTTPGFEPFEILDGHERSIEAMAVGTDGSWLASAGYDADIKVWAMPEARALPSVPANGNVSALASGPGGSWLAAGRPGAGPVRVWSMPDSEVLMDLGDHPLGVNALAASASWLASGSDDGVIRVWSMPSGKPRVEIAAHDGAVLALAASPDGSLLASGGEDGTILLWAMPDGSETACLLDLAVIKGEIEVVTYEAMDAAGGTVTHTLGCGSPLPGGALCTCNCVAVTGGICTCVGHQTCTCVGHTTCSCVGDVCSCVGDVCSCVGDTGGGTHYWYPN